MDHFKDLESIFCSNAGYELKQSTSPEDRLKPLDNIGPSTNTQNSNVRELRDWKTINDDDGKKIKITNNCDDLISFKDDNITSLICIDDTPNHINLVPEKPINVNSKYYNDLKTVFGTSASDDDFYSCIEKVTLGKVNTFKTENRDGMNENLMLGRVTPMKNILNTTVTKSCMNSINMELNRDSNFNDLGEIPASSAKKGVDLVDLFENISVTPKDITQHLNKYDANIGNDNELNKIKTDNQHGPVQLNFKANISKNNELVSVLPNMDAKTMVLASKDDKMFQIQGNNITIKCDRTYVISPGHSAPSSTCTVCCKCHKKTDEKVLSKNVIPGTTEVKPEKLFANISNGSVDRAAEILKNSLEMLKQAATAKSEVSTGTFQSVKHFDDISKKKANNTMKTLISYDEIGQPSFSKQHVEETKANNIITKETLKATIRSESATKAVHKEMGKTVKFVPEVLEENHALRRCVWQGQQAAVDEFIHGRKVIMGKEKKRK